MSDIAERVLRQLYEAWQATVELTLARADLGAAVGWTHYPTRTAYLDYTLTFEEWLSTLEHEVTHLLHAPESAEHGDDAAPDATVTTLVPHEPGRDNGRAEEPTPAALRLAVDLEQARRRLRAAPSPRTPDR